MQGKGRGGAARRRPAQPSHPTQHTHTHAVSCRPQGRPWPAVLCVVTQDTHHCLTRTPSILGTSKETTRELGEAVGPGPRHGPCRCLVTQRSRRFPCRVPAPLHSRQAQRDHTAPPQCRTGLFWTSYTKWHLATRDLCTWLLSLSGLHRPIHAAAAVRASFPPLTTTPLNGEPAPVTYAATAGLRAASTWGYDKQCSSSSRF